MSVILYLTVLFLSVLGLCDLIHNIHLSFLRVKNRKNKIVCCVLNDELADLQLVYVAEQLNWFGKKYADSVIAIDCLQDDDLSERCLQIANTNNIKIIKRENIFDYINTEL